MARQRDGNKVEVVEMGRRRVGQKHGKKVGVVEGWKGGRVRGIRDIENLF